MKVLIIGHSLVVDANRKIWDILGKNDDLYVDLILPKSWKSNLIKDVEFTWNKSTDSNIKTIYPLSTFFKGSGSFHFYNPIIYFLILFKNKYDVIVMDQEVWSFSLLELQLLRLFTKNKSAKLFLTVAQNIKKKNLYWMRFYERLNTFGINSILYCSRGVMEVIKWKGIKNSCKYFPLSYDNEIYQEMPSIHDGNKIILGYIGRVSEEKGIRVLLDACKLLKSKKVNFQLIIAGNGPLVELIKKEKFVKYLGVIPHIDAYKFYKDIDVFILPSQTRTFWKEQFGRVIVESIASNRPVIGSNSGSIPEVMGKLNHPFVFKEDSPQSLVKQIELINMKIIDGSIEVIMKKSVKLCRDLYSHDALTKRLLKYIKDYD